MVFGFSSASVKGCVATLTTTKADFYPGEVVQGTLTLDVSTPVDCQEFTLTLAGVEEITWSIPDSDGATYCDQKNDVCRQKVALLQPSQTTLTTGQHVYPFAFPLPTMLPPSSFTLPCHVDGWSCVRVHVTYEVIASIHAKNAKAAKEVAKKEVTVHAVPLDAVLYPGRATQQLKSTRVNRCCFHKGDCAVTLTTDRDTCDINSGTLSFTATVNNETSLTIQSLEFGVGHVQDVHIPSGVHQRTASGDPYYFHTHTLDLCVGPHSTKEGIRFTVSMAELHASFQKTNAHLIAHMDKPGTLAPTSDLYFASVRFRAKVDVRFTSWSCTPVKVELPISLLNLATFTAPVPAKNGADVENVATEQVVLRDAVVVTDIS